MARERLAIIWNDYANNEILLIMKHGQIYIALPKWSQHRNWLRQKNKLAPVTCVVGRSIIMILGLCYGILRR